MTTMGGLNPAWGQYLFFAEYPTTPPVYTLNGFMQVLVGLKHWREFDPESDTEALLARGLSTLEKILPLYDVYGLSAYDLGHFTHRTEPYVLAKYHYRHVKLLATLAEGQRRPVIDEYLQRWRAAPAEWRRETRWFGVVR